MTHDRTGQKIKSDSKVQKLIEDIAQVVSAHNQNITGPREASPEYKMEYDDLLKRVEKFRGRPLFYPYIGSGAGQGVYVELEDGSVKLDLINGIGIHVMGHGHPRIIKAALQGAMSDIVMQGHLQINQEYLKMGERLVSLAGRKSKLKHAWLSTCGTIANENALKLARQKNTPARKIISMKNAFAGRSTMMAEITDNPEYKQGLPEYNEVLRIPYYDAKDPKSKENSLIKFKEYVAANEKNIAAFVFEPMLGEGGYYYAPRDFFIPMLEFCKEKGIAVWADEVQTFCRTGELFAFETLDIGNYLDLCTIAKTAQSAATLYTADYNPKPGLIAGTFASSTVSFQTGLAVIDEMVEGRYFGKGGKIEKIHNSFVKMLNELNETTCKGLLQDAGGLGLMVAVTPLDGSKEKVGELLKIMFKNGLMAFNCGKGPYRLRFLIPAVMTEKDIQVTKHLLEKSILELAGK